MHIVLQSTYFTITSEDENGVKATVFWRVSEKNEYLQQHDTNLCIPPHLIHQIFCTPGYTPQNQSQNLGWVNPTYETSRLSLLDRGKINLETRTK